MGKREKAGTDSSGAIRELAEEALRELLEVASQVEAAAIVDRTGTPLAATFGQGTSDEARAAKLGSLARTLLDQAEGSRAELGREPIVQCEVATGNAHVFVVTAGDHAIIAVTGTEPTVGLVFYDLKTALRTLRDAGTHAVAEQSRNGSSSRDKVANDDGEEVVSGEVE